MNRINQEVQDHLDSGWKVDSNWREIASDWRVSGQGEDEIVLTKSNGWGSLFVHFMLLVCTVEFAFLFLIPNLLYYAICSHKCTKLYMRVQNEITSDAEASSPQLL